MNFTTKWIIYIIYKLQIIFWSLLILSLFIKLNIILILYITLYVFIYLSSFILKFVHGRNIIFEFELFNSLA